MVGIVPLIGETIETKVRRITQNKEPIKDGAPILYTDRSEGVRADTDIRTDRFEIAVEAMDKVTQSHLAKREAKHKTPVVDINEGKAKDGGPESIPATESK